MKNRNFAIIAASITLLLSIILAAGNLLGFQTFSDFLTKQFGVEGLTETSDANKNYFSFTFKSAEEASLQSKKLCEQIEEEGAVLLKNANNALPLEENSSISIFSQSSVDMVICSSGESEDTTYTYQNLQNALEQVGINVNPTLTNFYKNKNAHRQIGGLEQGMSKDPYLWKINEIPYDEYTEEVKASYQKYSDAAIIVISRDGCQNADLPTDMSSSDNRNERGAKSILELDTDERELIENVCSNFEKVVVLLNTSNAFECGFLNEYNIDACLWVGEIGQYGLISIARILTGKANPSGRLTDTYPYDVFSSPSMQNWGNFAYVDSYGKETGHHYITYAEGIYVGYKYYETRYEDRILNQGNAGDYEYDEVVQFPFGYGLSYSNFTWSDFIYYRTNTDIEISVKVTNTGAYTGKDVIQLYFQSPYTQYDITNHIEKSSVNLIGFEKTKLLKPMESETIKITTPINQLKSYDAHGLGTYLLEEGKYFFTIAKNAHSAVNNILQLKGYNVGGDVEFCKSDTLSQTIYDKDNVTGIEITNQFDDSAGNKTYLSRHDWSTMDNNGLRDGTNSHNRYDNDGYIYESIIDIELRTKLEKVGYEASGAPYINYTEPTFNANNHKSLIDLKDKDFNDQEWSQLLDQLRIKELEKIVTSSGNKTYAIPSVGKPFATDSAGTSSWESFIGDGMNSGGMPNETVQAATFNIDLAYQVGQIMGELSLWSKENFSAATTNLTGWYAPALNIHRSPFGGRNFEYYSECPILTGLIGSSVVKGAMEKGLITYIKHFAFNEQETNKMTNIVTWSNEQAIRETYLVPFELCVKEGKTLGVMTAYPRIGTTWTGGSYNLITNVLRKEWGFNGFVISDYLDGDYENCDQMLAAGGDAALCLEETSVSTESPQAKTYLRNAAHHLLYSFVNSNGMNGIAISTSFTGGTPIYYRIMIFFNIFFGTFLILFISLTVVFIIKDYQRKKIISVKVNEINNSFSYQEGLSNFLLSNKIQFQNLNDRKQKILPFKFKVLISCLISYIIVVTGLILVFTVEEDDVTSNSNIQEIVNPLENNVDLNGKYGQIKKKNLTKGTTTDKEGNIEMFFNDQSIGYYYEAEDALLSSKPKIESNLSSSGEKYISHFQVGETITFSIESDIQTAALLILSTACYNSSPRLISDLLFGQFGPTSSSSSFFMDFGNRTIKGRNDWSNFSETYVCEVYLYQGNNIIQFSAYEDINLDYMCLVNPGAGLNLPPAEIDPIDYDQKYGHPDIRLLSSEDETFSSTKRGYIYEAENAQLSSNIRIDDNPDASCGKSISYFNPGEFMKFTINSEEDVTVMLTVSASEYNKNDFLADNVLLIKYGQDEDTLQELNTYQNTIHTIGGWDNYFESTIAEINLKKGNNIIFFISKTAINYDYITLINIWDGTPDPELPQTDDELLQYYNNKYGSPTKKDLENGENSYFNNTSSGYYYEAENAIISNGVIIYDDVNASNGAAISYFQDGRFMEYTITSNIDTEVLLIFSGSKYEQGKYAISSLMTVTYQFENQEKQKMIPSAIPFSPIGNSWNAYKEFIGGEINLHKGINTIRITSTNIPVNYDYICLVKPLSNNV